MNIQKRGNAFYLKNSIWDKEAKKTVSSSVYLASDAEEALIKLQKEVPESEFPKLRLELIEKNKLDPNPQKAKKIEQPIMKMECGRIQAWGDGAGEIPVEGDTAFCVWCQKEEKIIKVL